MKNFTARFSKSEKRQIKYENDITIIENFIKT